MSGMLHPAGPEAAGTYWLRRVMVLLAVAIAVLVTIGVARASSGATRSATPPAGPATPSAAAPSPTVTPSASPRPSTSPSVVPTPSASPSSRTAPSRGASAEAVAACAPKELKTTLSGKQVLKLGQPAAFTVAVRNDGESACRISLNRTGFELRVTAGKQPVWSSRSCTTATFVVAAKLELDQEMTWSMLWDGRGTAAGCVQPGAALKRGTYLATATVTGAKPASLPITLKS